MSTPKRGNSLNLQFTLKKLFLSVVILQFVSLAPLANAGLLDSLVKSSATQEEAPFDLNASPDSLVDKYVEVEVDREGMLKDIKRVAITQFQIEFLTQSSGGAFAKSGYSSNASNAATYVNAKLEGVGINEFQAITDRYYDKLVKDLNAAGIEVVDQAQVLADPDFKELTSGGKPSPAEEDADAGKGTFVSSRGMPIWFNQEEGFVKGSGFIAKKDVGKDVYQSFGTGFGGFSWKALGIHEPNLCKKFEAASLRVRITIPFVQIKGSAKDSVGSGNTEASATTRGKIQLEKWVTRLAFVTQDQKHARIRLKEPIVAATPVGDMKDATTGGDKAVDAAANVVAVASMFMGGPIKGTMQSTTSYVLQADPKLYVETVNSHLDATQKLLTTGLTRSK